jgi:hypothetical protein
MHLTPALASQFARIALGHVTREFPHKLDHVLGHEGEANSPRSLHPIFYGSYDWHSCVHGWWLLLTLLRLAPGLPEAASIRELILATFTPAKIEVEREYLTSQRSFERPYGWAWLLSLHAEASRHNGRLGAQLRPLAEMIAERFHDWLLESPYPNRTGGHANTAFALIHAHAWAIEHNPDLAMMFCDQARGWYGEDRNAQAWEPDGDAFLSPTLTEAHCMARLLPEGEFERWFADFLPSLDDGEPQTLFEPAMVGDRTDGKIVHLDGLNLSRAWNWRALGRFLPLGHSGHSAGERHLAAALPHISRDYMGEHWLASFALLALLPAAP